MENADNSKISGDQADPHALRWSTIFFIGNYAHPVGLEPTISSSTLLLQEKELPFQLELIDLKVEFYKNLSMNIFNFPE